MSRKTEHGLAPTNGYINEGHANNALNPEEPNFGILQSLLFQGCPMNTGPQQGDPGSTADNPKQVDKLQESSFVA